MTSSLLTPTHALLVSTALLICVGQTRASPVFSHDAHAERLHVRQETIECTRCHGTGWAISELRPGSVDHQTCAGAGCHADAFYEKGRDDWSFCKVCHTAATPQMSRGLEPFPSRDRASQEMCILFDHPAHLAPARRGDVPVDRMCDRCHVEASDDKKRRASPTHTHCAGCHDKRTAKLPMTDCAGCHESLTSLEKRRAAEGGSTGGAYTTCRPWLPDRGSRIVVNFDHDQTYHTTDITSGDRLSCDFCHQTAARQSDPRRIRRFVGAKTMERCRRCHNGQTVSPTSGERIFSTRRNCYGCHDDRLLGGLLTVPKDHR